MSDMKELTNRTSAFGLHRISYGNEHWLSGTPEIEASERNDRTSSKPNYKGWVGRTSSEFAVELMRKTASDTSGNEGAFGNFWKRSECFGPAVERRDRSSLPKTRTLWANVRLRLLRSLNASETGRKRSNLNDRESPVRLRISAEAR